MRDTIYKKFSMRLSKKKMAQVMYAIVMCKATITGSLGIGVYEYTPEQNMHNNVKLMVGIPKESVERFAEMAGVELEEPAKPTLN